MHLHNPDGVHLRDQFLPTELLKNVLLRLIPLPVHLLLTTTEEMPLKQDRALPQTAEGQAVAHTVRQNEGVPLPETYRGLQKEAITPRTTDVEVTLLLLPAQPRTQTVVATEILHPGTQLIIIIRTAITVQ